MASYYVDPSIDSDSGSGTIGDPYGDLQYALDSIYQDTTNGDRINIKSGTAEVLTGTLDYTTYGTPSISLPLHYEGYTSAEGDGGVGEIDGDGLYSIHDQSTFEGMHFRNLTLGNCGYNSVLEIDRFCGVHFCKIHTTSGNGVVSNGTTSTAITHTWFDNIGGYGTVSINSVHDCLFTNGATHSFNYGISGQGSKLNVVSRCCFKLSGTSGGIYGSTTTYWDIRYNSFYTTGTAGTAVKYREVYGSNTEANLVQGFTNGLTGYSSGEYGSGLVLNNAFYDCTTNLSNVTNELNNESLSANLFDLSGSISSFADRLTYFNPVDQGNVYTAMPGGLVKGAIQPAASGGGGGGIQIARGMHGGMRG
jgi:hypothetical protein